ncbi:MAG TPA: 3-dehydroquinate synthase [Thermodesulfobacteriota bacterium]|nr:3-dehydroquinate synthase [Thermodesulfobacteriota bacterium]
MNKIKVQLEKRSSASYEIYVGRNILDRVSLILSKGNWAKRYILVTDSNVSLLHGPRVLEILRKTDLKFDLIEFPAGEASKNMATCLSLVDRLIELQADRHSALIALGGGVVGDMTGFVASIYMRGIPFFQIPTTLMAQVDSSIGGKTGIDLPAGKNLLGSFYQPRAVFTDLTFLLTLKEREFNDGLAEILKYGIIEDPDLLSLVEEGVAGLRSKDFALLERIITKSCRIKKRIVELDEKEGGLRRLLNFGHTLGHAVEAESGYTFSHGEAVAVGMVCAARLSETLGYLPLSDRERIESLIQTLGLPHRIPGHLSTEGIYARLSKDKKKIGDVLPFVLLKRIGMPFINGGVPEAVIREIVEELKS